MNLDFVVKHSLQLYHCMIVPAEYLTLAQALGLMMLILLGLKPPIYHIFSTNMQDLHL